MQYHFCSFKSLHNGKLLGACIVKPDLPGEAGLKVELMTRNLEPNECHEMQSYFMDKQEAQEQGMQLNRFYTAREMKELGF